MSEALPSRVGLACPLLIVALLALVPVSCAVAKPRAKKPRAFTSKARAHASAKAKAKVRWVSLPAGSFRMGSSSGEADEKPVHRVRLRAFALSKSEVTVGQYRACVDAGRCSKPWTSSNGPHYNWGSGRDNHPINGVSWSDAKAFCAWIGGRLPSEAEWEYAARSAGKRQRYPWGDAKADCSRAVMDGGGPGMDGWGCGEKRTWTVCSKTAGNTAQGLCDMAGNVWEWVADCYQGSYAGAPGNSAARTNCSGKKASRVTRGGGWYFVATKLRASYRSSYAVAGRSNNLGIRCARTL